MSSMFPLIDGGVPASADAAGLGDRFHYWNGQSGRRYLFTAVSASELADFRDAIVVLATRDAAGRLGGHALTLIGADGPERASLARRLSFDSRLVAFVHLLAPTLPAREAVLDDLLGRPVRLAA